MPRAVIYPYDLALIIAMVLVTGTFLLLVLDNLWWPFAIALVLACFLGSGHEIDEIWTW